MTLKEEFIKKLEEYHNESPISEFLYTDSVDVLWAWIEEKLIQYTNFDAWVVAQRRAEKLIRNQAIDDCRKIVKDNNKKMDILLLLEQLKGEK